MNWELSLKCNGVANIIMGVNNEAPFLNLRDAKNSVDLNGFTQTNRHCDRFVFIGCVTGVVSDNGSKFVGDIVGSRVRHSTVQAEGFKRFRVTVFFVFVNNGRVIGH